jgi:hypothetical protein
MAALPAWTVLEPLTGALATYAWPAVDVAGPRALIQPLVLRCEAIAADAWRWGDKLGIEVHLPVDAAPALAALGGLRDALAALNLAGVRILAVEITAFERGKYVSAASSASLTARGDTTAEPTAWTTTSEVAHRAVLVLTILHV